MSTVALDAMGGDYAPAATVEGALRAAAASAGGEPIEVLLVGDEEAIERELRRLGGAPGTVRIVHAPDAIAMQEHAAIETRHRRQSSIYVGLELVKRGEADAFVSLGNTGAVLALALVVLGRLRGVERPALCVLIPRTTGPKLLLDVGANAESRASHLVQFAQLGVEYMRTVVGVPDPAVGLLSIGEEGTKGSPLIIEANAALSASTLRFIGNVEGRDIVEGDADVVVTDGFTGNVALKLAEGVVSVVFGEMRAVVGRGWRGRLGGALIRPAIREVRDRLDYRRYGGVPLLGVDGVVIVGHGRSDAEAVANAVRAADVAVRQHMLESMAAAIAAARAEATSRPPRLSGGPTG